jgi:hypothetical protein
VIFDIRVSDTDGRTYLNTAPFKVLQKQEKEKKTKYVEARMQACRHTGIQARRSFTPLVFSVDDMRSKETTAACKHLARLLSEKWSRSYTQVCGLVRSRLNIALVGSSSDS